MARTGAQKEQDKLRKAAKSYGNAAVLVARMTKDDAKPALTLEAMQSRAVTYGKAAQLVASMTKDDTVPPSSAAALILTCNNYGKAAQLVACMGKDDTEPPSSVSALKQRAAAYGKAAYLVACMSKDDAAPPSSMDVLRKAAYNYGKFSSAVAAMGKDHVAPRSSMDQLQDKARTYAKAAFALASMTKDDATVPTTANALRCKARAYGAAAFEVAKMTKDDVNRPRSAKELEAISAWQQERYDSFLQQAAYLKGLDTNAVTYPSMEILRKDWVQGCIKETMERRGYAPMEATAYGGLTTVPGGATERVAPETGHAHHKVVAKAAIFSDGSNASEYASSLPFEESIFKGGVDLHVVSDLNCADAVLKEYLVFSNTAKTPGAETAVIRGVYDAIDVGIIRKPHTMQLPDGGTGLGPSMHGEDAAIKARRTAEKLRASGVDVTRPDIVQRLAALDAAALCGRRKKELYLAVGVASGLDDDSPVWLASVSYYDQDAKLVARYTNVSTGLPGRLHLVGKNVAVDVKLYK